MLRESLSQRCDSRGTLELEITALQDEDVFLPPTLSRSTCSRKEVKLEFGSSGSITFESSEARIDVNDGQAVELNRAKGRFGSSGWTRTSNPPVNSLTWVFGLVGSSVV